MGRPMVVTLYFSQHLIVFDFGDDTGFEVVTLLPLKLDLAFCLEVKVIDGD